MNGVLNKPKMRSRERTFQGSTNCTSSFMNKTPKPLAADAA
jgi:hypothetical protein